MIQSAFSAPQLFGFQLNNVADLVNLVTGIMWLSGPFHSAVNYGQWDHSMVPAGMPSALAADPTVAGTTLLDMMLPKQMYIRQVEVIWLLSGRRMMLLHEVPPLSGFTPAHIQYVTKLLQIDAAIVNTVRPFRYDVLRPTRIAAAANV